jgi:hypothetical protein
VAQQKQTRLPNLSRNPIVLGELAVELLEHADNVEKTAAENGRAAREKPRVQKIRAFAAEMQRVAEAKIGNQLDNVE